MLTFPGAPPDIGCTWVHYSFSTTFGSRRVRSSVCVFLVVDDTTCICVRLPCVYVSCIRVDTRVFPLSFHASVLPSLSTLSTSILVYSFTLTRLSSLSLSLSWFTSDSTSLSLSLSLFFLFLTLPIFPLFSLRLPLSTTPRQIRRTYVAYLRLSLSSATRACSTRVA